MVIVVTNTPSLGTTLVSRNAHDARFGATLHRRTRKSHLACESDHSSVRVEGSPPIRQNPQRSAIFVGREAGNARLA